MWERIGKRALPVLPALALAAVAGWQIHLARSEHLSGWKGGGFGMFSSTDVEANRYTRIYLRRGASAVPVAVPDDLAALDTRVCLHPSPSRLRDLGRRVGRRLENDFGPLTGVRVEVWRLTFEPATLEPHPVLLRQVEVPLDGE